MLTIAAAFEQFNENVRPAVVATYSATDIVALREAWNDYTDSLTNERDGLNSLQYQYCPAVDDTMPDDDLDSELEFLLDAMGVTFTRRLIDKRPDGLMDDMPEGSKHYETAISRAAQRVVIHYSQGPGIKSSPDLLDVLQSWLMDSTDETFEDWAESLGYDTDSRKAERTYNACVLLTKDLAAMFSTSEIEDLREMFSDR